MPKYISPETVKAVIERTDLVSLVGEYTRLERRGSDWWGCCPFHAEKTPSFHVIPDRGMYYCFGCHEGGNAVDFVKNIEKVNFPEAVTQLARKAGIEIQYSGNQNTTEEDKSLALKNQYIDLYTRVAGSYSYCLLSTPTGKKALDYILSRGITLDTIKKFQLGYSPANRKWLKAFLKSKHYSDAFLAESGLFSKKYPDISFFSDRLMFPIWNRQGQVVAFGGRLLEGEGPKYLNSGDLLQYHKGETLYGFNLARQKIRETRSVILCEGYMDVIAYHQSGITQAVAPLGTALTEQQVKLVRPFVDTVYLSFDSDKAGKEATWKAILLCRQTDVTVKIISLSGGKDPAEILLNQGVEILTNCINSAMLDSDYLLSLLAKEHQINTPEGKTRAALAFFPYIDALKSDMQKESSLAQLCQEFNLSLEAVKRDFNNRDFAEKRLEQSKDVVQSKPVPIKMNAELRAILSVVANLQFYKLMRSFLTADDFENPVARELFIILEECFREDVFSHGNILEKCSDERLKNMVAKAVTSGEYADNQQQVIEDSIRLIRKNSLERKRERLLNQIRQLTSKPTDWETQSLLEDLISEKMNIDFELNSKDAH